MSNRHCERPVFLNRRSRSAITFTFGSGFSLRPGGTRDSSPAIYRRVGHKYDLRPGGTLEVGSGPPGETDGRMGGWACRLRGVPAKGQFVRIKKSTHRNGHRPRASAGSTKAVSNMLQIAHAKIPRGNWSEVGKQ